MTDTGEMLYSQTGMKYAPERIVMSNTKTWAKPELKQLNVDRTLSGLNDSTTEETKLVNGFLTTFNDELAS